MSTCKLNLDGGDVNENESDFTYNTIARLFARSWNWINFALFFPHRIRWFASRSSACWFSFCSVCWNLEQTSPTTQRLSSLKLFQRWRQWLRTWILVTKCCTFWTPIQPGPSSKTRITTCSLWTRISAEWLLVSGSQIETMSAAFN